MSIIVRNNYIIYESVVIVGEHLKSFGSPKNIRRDKFKIKVRKRFYLNV